MLHFIFCILKVCWHIFCLHVSIFIFILSYVMKAEILWQPLKKMDMRAPFGSFVGIFIIPSLIDAHWQILLYHDIIILMKPGIETFVLDCVVLLPARIVSCGFYYVKNTCWHSYKSRGGVESRKTVVNDCVCRCWQALWLSVLQNAQYLAWCCCGFVDQCYS